MTEALNTKEKTRLGRATRLKAIMDEARAILRQCDREDRTVMRRENYPLLNDVLDQWGKFVDRDADLPIVDADIFFD